MSTDTVDTEAANAGAQPMTPSAAASPIPKENPDSLALRTKPRPVTRLNRRVLMVGAGLLSAAVLGGAMWSLGAKPRRTVEQSAELHNTEKVEHAEGLAKVPSTYIGYHAELGSAQAGDVGRALARAQQPDSNSDEGSHQPAMEVAAQNARLERQREIEQVAAAPVLFKTSAHAVAPSSEHPDAAALAGASAADNFNAVPATPSSDPSVAPNLQEHKQAFVDRGGDAATRGSGTLLPAPSPYAVMAGSLISAALVTGINSDLPGQIIASVTEPVYDSPTGRYLLIPQGSRLMGRYDSQVAFGQRRVLVVWTRLILPDTSSITLDRLPGVDTAGYAGLEDGVDWHWSRIFAGAAVSTLIGVGAELAAPDRNGSDGRVVIATRESAQESVNQVGQEITKRNLAVQPTLTERPGLPVRVIVNKDLVLRPYQPLFFGRSAK